jgi:hypothetical protein
MCRETAIAMYGDSRFQRVPYRTHLSPFCCLGERPWAALARKMAEIIAYRDKFIR